jgi:hypothetical protein
MVVESLWCPNGAVKDGDEYAWTAIPGERLRQGQSPIASVVRASCNTRDRIEPCVLA